MKRLIFLVLSIFLLLQGCDGNDEGEQEEPQLDVTVENLMGSWLSIEISEDNSTGNMSFRELEESEMSVLTFGTNLVVTNSRFNCEGTYQLDDRSVTFDFSCIETTNPTSFVSSLTEFELILSTAIPEAEGFTLKYKRL